nr:patellin-3-like [Ipomoea batatas]
MAHEEAVQVEEVVVVPEVSSKPLPANADSVPKKTIGSCIEEEDTSSEPSVQSQESQTYDGAKMVEAIAETIISVSTLEDAKTSVQSNTNPENQQPVELLDVVEEEEVASMEINTVKKRDTRKCFAIWEFKSLKFVAPADLEAPVKSICNSRSRKVNTVAFKGHLGSFSDHKSECN